MLDQVRIRTALLSVTDKSGIVELAQALAAQGVHLISTGGTRAVLLQAGLSVTEVSEITGNPEAFHGRMKTISFPLTSGLLFDRERDAAEAAQLAILAIDLVVANLYDFAGNKDLALPLSELIEFIDIGGPTMIRAAAKNFAAVAVLTNPLDYPDFLNEFVANTASTCLETRTTLMRRAFALTASYDGQIAEHLSGQSLRYGENPHQNAVFVPASRGIQLQILGGKAMSYNNLVDLDAALAAVWPLAQPACAIVKHENPCGLAMGEAGAELLELAWAGDPVSAFGSVIAFNRTLSKADLEFLAMDDKTQRKFVEIVAAPAFSDDALQYLRQNKNLRIVAVTAPHGLPTTVRRLLGVGTLIQNADGVISEKFDVVSETKPAHTDRELADFGMHAVKCIKSNAIAIVRRRGTTMQLLGMGAGQPNRLKSVELAVAQAQANLRAEAAGANSDAYLHDEMAASYLTSDAFFPFADGVERALDAGITTIIEPGGSMRDADVVAACNHVNAVLIFTGTRHFRH